MWPAAPPRRPEGAPQGSGKDSYLSRAAGCGTGSWERRAREYRFWSCTEAPELPMTTWSPWETLSSDRPVIFYDQLGCGNSDRSEDPSLWTVERFVDEVVLVRKALLDSTGYTFSDSPGALILPVEYNLSQKPDGVMSLVLSGPCLSAPRWVADQHAYLTHLPQETRKTIRETEATGGIRIG